ncbi:MAG: endonuclease/exonuclease/phosphatase family protein [Oscillospiraceae bacterium]
MTEEKTKKRGFFAVAGLVLLILVLAVVWLIGWLTLGEYKPAERETLALEGAASKYLCAGDTVKVMTWNIGYAALGDDADFFMDGGSHVFTADEERVQENLQAVIGEIYAVYPDVIFLQEVDRDSSRSHHIDEALQIMEACTLCRSSFAYNYRVMFVPYPLPPLGKVNSGIMTLTAYPISSAERIQLPVPFSWPVRTANLKRCAMVDRIPIYGSDKELVLVNLHLEAYDDGDGRIAQTEMLREILEAEAAAGNYVIAGGDFNQSLSPAADLYPHKEGTWNPPVIDAAGFGSGWQFAVDAGTPTCRLLDEPYAGADQETFAYYVIDGFIVSKGLEIVSVNTQDLDFENSDHNPVVMQVRIPEA